MPAITLGSARALSCADLTELLNRAFADDSAPVHLSCADLEATITHDDILIDASHVAYVDGAPAGVALAAVRARREGMRTRLATMGVVPEHRRLGVGRALLRRVIDEARMRGARTLLVEVLAHNVPARVLYEAHGFVPRRRLVGFTVASAPLRSRRVGRVHLQPIGAHEALAHFATCTAQEMAEAAPPWQLDAPSLARLGSSTRMYAVVPAGATRAAGYLVLGQSDSVAGLVHLGVVPAWRRQGLGTAALAAALREYPTLETLYVPPLVPAASSLVPFLQALGGVRDRDEQIEMELALC
jgi:GNAT superfamily N-acetyltransferase